MGEAVIHSFTLWTYVRHLFFDGLGDAGGYYAATFCKHKWHRVGIAIACGLLTTLALVSLIG
jgi:hypothetical protein